MDPEEMVKAGYDTIASEYLKIRSEDSEDVLLLQELVERLPRGAKVLDAGCGAGVPITRFLSRHFDVTGVDFSEEQVRLARQLVPEARFLCQDMTELSFSDGCFDAICSYYAIIHIPREVHQRLFQDFQRILKPGGLILVCLGAGDVSGGTEDDYLGVPMYWSHYDADTNIDLLNKAGFQAIWSRIVVDSTDPSAAHLFVLGRNHRC